MILIKNLSILTTDSFIMEKEKNNSFVKSNKNATILHL